MFFLNSIRKSQLCVLSDQHLPHCDYGFEINIGQPVTSAKTPVTICIPLCVGICESKMNDARYLAYTTKMMSYLSPNEFVSEYKVSKNAGHGESINVVVHARFKEHIML